MKVAKIEGDQFTLAMTAAEADLLMFALVGCDSPAANDTITAMAAFFGYIPALKDGPVPEVGKPTGPKVEAKTVYLKAPFPAHASPYGVTIPALQNVADVAALAECGMAAQLNFDKVINAIKALRSECKDRGVYCDLYAAKTVVDMIRDAYNDQSMYYEDVMQGNVKFVIV